MARQDLYRLGSAAGTDHGTLIGLEDDDHPQYANLAGSSTVTGRWTFAPDTVRPPFYLGANALGQTVTGLSADLLDGLNATDFALVIHTHTKVQITDLEDISTTPAADTIPLADGAGEIADDWLTSNIARLDTAQAWLAGQLMLLTNYAHGSLPAAATSGRIMYDSTNKRIMVDDGALITPNYGKQYGNLYIDENAGSVTFALNAGTPAVVEWSSLGEANEITQDIVTNYDLEVDDAGLYMCLVSLSFSGSAAGQVYEAHVFINGTQQEQAGLHRKINNANDVGNANLHTILSLSAGDDVDVRIDCAVGTPNVTVEDGQFTLLRIA